jgi:protoporphyrinogen oxidase
MTPRVTVVGAGIAGLGAAYLLRRAGWQPTVLESSAQVGGRMTTTTKDGFTWEPAAHFMWRHYREMRWLCGQLRPPIAFHNVTPHAGALLPDDRIYRFRTNSPLALFRHPELSATDSIRICAHLAALIARARSTDPHLPADLAALDDGRSLRSWGDAAIGARGVDAALAPGLSSLIFWPPEQSPWRFALGVMALTTHGWFVPSGGMGEVPARLARELPVELGVTATQVRDLGPDGASVSCVSRTGQRFEVTSECVVVATPAPIAAGLLADPASVLGPRRAAYLGSATYHRSMPVTLGFPRSPEPRVYGIAVPMAQRRPILAIGWEHNKLPGRNETGAGVATVMPSGDLVESCWDQPDDLVVEQVVAEVERAYPGSAGQIAVADVHRWEHATPRMPPGRYRQLADALAADQPSGRVFLCGDYWAGPSTEFSLTSGFRAAGEALRALRGAGDGLPQVLDRVAVRQVG